MGNVRRLALISLIWTARNAFELGDQLHHGWLLANADRDIHF